MDGAITMDESLVSPHTLTILCTYTCTAACKQCCFESSPRVTGRLPLESILKRISEAHESFPDLRLVSFSGGEATILKDDLVQAVAHASSLGLLTRVVSNGSWGKSKKYAKELIGKLKDAGLNELNISTGADHQEWVPHESVVNAAFVAVESGIHTLVTVEVDNEESDCLRRMTSDPTIKQLSECAYFNLQSNTWMPFHADAESRRQADSLKDDYRGCNQVFNNVVITPHDNLSACCGLTLEHIPEMRLGSASDGNMGDLYRNQVNDFMKIWLRVDGPHQIISRVLGERGKQKLEGVVHICQACAMLHQDDEIKGAILGSYERYIPEVTSRFVLSRAIEQHVIPPR